MIYLAGNAASVRSPYISSSSSSEEENDEETIEMEKELNERIPLHELQKHHQTRRRHRRGRRPGPSIQSRQRRRMHGLLHQYRQQLRSCSVQLDRLHPEMIGYLTRRGPLASSETNRLLQTPIVLIDRITPAQLMRRGRRSTRSQSVASAASSIVVLSSEVDSDAYDDSDTNDDPIEILSDDSGSGRPYTVQPDEFEVQAFEEDPLFLDGDGVTEVSRPTVQRSMVVSAGKRMDLVARAYASPEGTAWTTTEEGDADETLCEDDGEVLPIAPR